MYYLIFYVLPAVIGLGYFLYKKKKAGEQKPGDWYRQKGDPEGQALYDQTHADKDPLTKDEKLELSWEFLYDITEKVLDHFPEQDKQEINKIGKQMVEAGAGYEHVIEYGIRPDKSKTKMLQEQEKTASTEPNRNV